MRKTHTHTCVLPAATPLGALLFLYCRLLLSKRPESVCRSLRVCVRSEALKYKTLCGASCISTLLPPPPRLLTSTPPFPGYVTLRLRSGSSTAPAAYKKPWSAHIMVPPRSEPISIALYCAQNLYMYLYSYMQDSDDRLSCHPTKCTDALWHKDRDKPPLIAGYWSIQMDGFVPGGKAIC